MEKISQQNNISKLHVEIIRQGHDAPIQFLIEEKDTDQLKKICLDVLDDYLSKISSEKDILDSTKKLFAKIPYNDSNHDFYLECLDKFLELEVEPDHFPKYAFSAAESFLNFLFESGLVVTKYQSFYFRNARISEYMADKVNRSVLRDAAENMNPEHSREFISKHLDVLIIDPDIFEIIPYYLNMSIGKITELVDSIFIKLIKKVTNDKIINDYLISFVEHMYRHDKLVTPMIKIVGTYFKPEKEQSKLLISALAHHINGLVTDDLLVSFLTENEEMFDPSDILNYVIDKNTTEAYQKLSNVHVFFNDELSIQRMIYIEPFVKLVIGLSNKISPRNILLELIEKTDSQFVVKVVSSDFMTKYDVHQNDNEIFEIVSAKMDGSTMSTKNNFYRIKVVLENHATGPTKTRKEILISACKKGNLYDVKKLFLKNGNDSFNDSFNQSLMEHAIVNGNKDIVEFFLNKIGRFFQTFNKTKFIELAIKKGQSHMIVMLFKKINYTSSDIDKFGLVIPNKNQMLIFNKCKKAIHIDSAVDFKAYLKSFFIQAHKEGHLELVAEILKTEAEKLEYLATNVLKDFVEANFIHGVFMVLHSCKKINLCEIKTESKEIQLLLDLFGGLNKN